jgi:CBS domain containing-hemolysin-like protein
LIEWVALAASISLVAACGVFVAAEFSLLAADRAVVEQQAAHGDRRARGVLAALRGLSTQLAGVQVGITLTNLAIGLLSEPAIARLLHSPLRAIGVGGGGADAVAVTVALVASTTATMVFGELLPKNLAIAKPVAVAKAVQAPVRAFTGLMRAPIRLLNGLASAILRPFGVKPTEELASARSAEELVSLVRHSAREGTLPERTADLLVRSLGFGGKTAGDVLTPRTQVVSIGAEATVAGLLALVRRSGHSRMPVTGPGGLDDVVGVVELDRAVGVPAPARSRTAVRTVMTAPTEVPRSLPLEEVLRALQAQRTQLAVVIDEYGGTAGLLTAEDLAEELAGEIEDEYDQPVPAARRVAGGWDVSGLLRPDEVRTLTGHRLPEGGYDTVGGLVLRELGRIPAPGDRAVVAGVVLTVTRMDGRRVDRLLLAGPDE